MLVLGAAALLAAATPWSLPSTDASDSMPTTNGNVYALEQVGSVLYIGGKFTSVGGQARQNLAAIDVRTGQVTGWNPVANRDVWGIDAAADGQSVYVTGTFNRIRGQRRVKVAEIDLAGNPTGFSARLRGGRGHTVAATSSAVYVGGRFTEANGVTRNYMAALHPTTGGTLAFDPGLDAQVWDIEVAPDGYLWVAGNFATVRGISRHGLAEIDPSTAQATAFSPAVRVATRDVAVGPSPDRVYVGTAGRGGWVLGYDTSSASGRLLWSLHLDGDMQAVDANQVHVFAGGHPSSFYGGSGSVDNTLSVEAETGRMASWGATSVGGKGAWEILATNEGLWVGGDFDRIGREPHGGLAFFPG